MNESGEHLRERKRLDTPNPPVFGAASIHRATAILNCLSRNVSLSLTALAALVELPAPTTHRIANALMAEGYVHRDENTHAFRLGNRAVRLGDSVNRRITDQQIRRGARELSANTGESVCVGMPIVDQVIISLAICSPNKLRVHRSIGSRIPSRQNALSQVLRAFGAIPASKAFECTTTHVAQIRRQGFALDNGQAEPGIIAVAAPLEDNLSERAAAAIAVELPACRATSQRVQHVISETVRVAIQISRPYRALSTPTRT